MRINNQIEEKGYTIKDINQNGHTIKTMDDKIKI